MLSNHRFSFDWDHENSSVHSRRWIRFISAYIAHAHLKRIWFISPRFDFCIRFCCKIVCSASINIMTPSQCMLRRLVHFFPASNGNMHAKQTGLFHLRFPFCVRLCFHIIFPASIEIMRPFKCILENEFASFLLTLHMRILVYFIQTLLFAFALAAK